MNGIERNKLDYRQYFNQLIYIQQDAHVFNDTIRNNLTMGQNIEDSILFNILEYLNLEEFFERCHRDLDFIIEDQGSNISGGEKQRICLGRALLSNKKTLILDESFSAIDQNNIQDILTKVLEVKDMTIIMTAHNIKSNMYPLFSKVYGL